MSCNIRRTDSGIYSINSNSGVYKSINIIIYFYIYNFVL